MSNKLRKFIVTGLIICTLIIQTGIGNAQNTETLSLMADSQTVQVGDKYEVTLHAEDVTDIYGFEASVFYNPEMTKFIPDESESVYQGFNFTKTDDKGGGRLLIAFTRTGDASPISEDGDIYLMTFEALKEGDIQLVLEYVKIVDSSENSKLLTIGSALSITAAAHTAPKYNLIVIGGSGSAEYAEGATVTITANAAPEGKVFDKWTSTEGITFANKNEMTTTFTMPAKAVTVTATYKDKPADNDDGDDAGPDTGEGNTGDTDTDPGSGNTGDTGIVSGGGIGNDEKDPAPGITVPISGGTQVMNITATTSGSTVTIEPLSDTELQRITDAAAEAGKPVSIDLSALDDGYNAAVIPHGVLSGIAASDAPGLEITMPDGKAVSFDSDALTALLNNNPGDLKIEIQQISEDALNDDQKKLVGDSLVIDLTAFIGTTQVHDFGEGFATISIPVDGEPVEHPIVWRMTVTADGEVNLEAIECTYNAATKCYEFQTGTFSEYVIGSYPFVDTPDNEWYYEDAVYAYVNGLFSGTTGINFSPDMAMSRGMMVTVLWRLESSPVNSGMVNFNDVAPDAWYYDAVTWAATNKIVNGYGNGKFGPNDNITREQMATILYRYAQYKGYDVSSGESTNVFSYIDASEISDYAILSMQWICGAGIMRGNKSMLMPQGNATRAQVAAILRRF